MSGTEAEDSEKIVTRSYRMSPATVEALNQYCASTGRKKDFVVNFAIKDFLKQMKGKK